MKYLSRDGCLFYFDRVLYNWRVCEPTTLFLLGFESATSFDNSSSDVIQISRYSYHSYNDTLVAYKDFDIFDRIYGFLSLLGSVDDNELYSEFNCNGAKLLLNEYTGVALDRTIPIIFKNDINCSAVDLNTPMNRVSQSDYLTYSINDLRTQKIHDIFIDADYSNPDYKHTDFLSTDYTDDAQAIKTVNAYNDLMSDLHSERKFNSNIYRLIDYKSMYSYALGVLYGCRCLGYNKESIWRLDPKFWYNGDNKNLVDTAWRVFRFHYIDQLPEQDVSYKDIVYNKLWNFTNDENSDVILRSDEIQLTSVGIAEDPDTHEKSVLSLPIVYSSSPQQYIPLYGSVFNLTEWLDIDINIISDDNNTPVRDLINPDELSNTRYVGQSPIKLFPAYRQDDYLNNYCFTAAGNLGWVKFDKNDFNHIVNGNESLSIYPKSLNSMKTPDKYIEISTGELVLGFSCYINWPEQINSFICGMLKDFTYINDSGTFEYKDDASFYRLVSSTNIDDFYVKLDSQLPGTPSRLYNLSDTVNVIRNGENVLVNIVNSTPEWESMYNFGYSFYSSADLPVFIEKNDAIVKSELRYYFRSSLVYFWDSENKESGFIPQSLTEPLPNGKYLVYDTVTLYKNVIRLLNNVTVYSNEFERKANTIVVKQIDNTSRYIFDDGEFISLSILHDEQGITEYACPIIYNDDFGNSLLDIDGNPLVWYDEYNQKYWNGLSLSPAWQSEKPRLLVGVTMYDSSENLLLPIVDNTSTHEVTINGVTITYSEFYSNDNYGIIRETLNVFSALSGMIDCYYDSYSDEYCIPNVTSEWVSRASISSLGYRFVDGIETLYDGVEEVEVVTDSDDTD